MKIKAQGNAPFTVVGPLHVANISRVFFAYPRIYKVIGMNHENAYNNSHPQAYSFYVEFRFFFIVYFVKVLYN